MWRSDLAFALFMGWVFLGAYDHDLGVLVISLVLAIHGLAGIVRRRIMIRGKGGPYRTYEGSQAVYGGATFVLFGMVLGGWAAHNIWFRLTHVAH